MAIRLADTARPNNYVDAEHLGTYPVAYAEDVWFADGTRLSEKTFGDSGIQVEELPLAQASEEGKVYQYIGATGTYKHGYFYECIEDSEVDPPVYNWQIIDYDKDKVIFSSIMPDIETAQEGLVLCYTGEDTFTYKKNHFYIKRYRSAANGIMVKCYSRDNDSNYTTTVSEIPIKDGTLMSLYDTGPSYIVKMTGEKSFITYNYTTGLASDAFKNWEVYSGATMYDAAWWEDITETPALTSAIKYIEHLPAEKDIEDVVYGLANFKVYTSTGYFSGIISFMNSLFTRTSWTDPNTGEEFENAYFIPDGYGFYWTPREYPSNRYKANLMVFKQQNRSVVFSGYKKNGESYSQYFSGYSNDNSFETFIAYELPIDIHWYMGDSVGRTVYELKTGGSEEFIGTKAEWEALSQSQKNKYDGKIVNIVEDSEASTKEIEELTNYTIPQEALTIFPDLALRLHVYKYGKIIQVCCDNIAIGDRSLLGDYFKVAEGLPAPLCTINFTYPAFPDETLGKSTTAPGYIGTGGTIMLRHVGMISDSATYLQGFSVVYLTREA